MRSITISSKLSGSRSALNFPKTRNSWWVQLTDDRHCHAGIRSSKWRPRGWRDCEVKSKAARGHQVDRVMRSSVDVDMTSQGPRHTQQLHQWTRPCDSGAPVQYSRDSLVSPPPLPLGSQSRGWHRARSSPEGHIEYWLMNVPLFKASPQKFQME